jgi:hypothetical protein
VDALTLVLRPRVVPFLAGVRAVARFFEGALVAAFFAKTAGFSGVAAPSIRNFERSFTSLIQAGGRACPLQVSPVLGFRYLAGIFPFAAAPAEDFAGRPTFLETAFAAPDAAFLAAGRPRGFLVDRYASISAVVRWCALINAPMSLSTAVACLAASVSAWDWSLAIFA